MCYTNTSMTDKPKPETKDRQVNLRVAPEVLADFDAACRTQAQSRTETITKLMIVYGQDYTHASTHHLDGEPCPLQQLLDGIRQQVVSRLK